MDHSRGLLPQFANEYSTVNFERQAHEAAARVAMPPLMQGMRLHLAGVMEIILGSSLILLLLRWEILTCTSEAIITRAPGAGPCRKMYQ
jgi:hypothetical protein